MDQPSLRLLIRAIVPQDCVNQFQQVVSNRDIGFRLPKLTHPPVEFPLEDRLFRTRRRPPSLHQRSRRNLFPFLILLLLLLPAERLFPGQIPAQLDKCFAEGNWLMSGPISASMIAAVIS